MSAGGEGEGDRRRGTAASTGGPRAGHPGVRPQTVLRDWSVWAVWVVSLAVAVVLLLGETGGMAGLAGHWGRWRWDWVAHGGIFWWLMTVPQWSAAGRRRRGMLAGGLAVLVVALESGQVFTATRTVDWTDAAAGLGGIATGWLWRRAG